jgi:hypothetical protein
MGSGSVRKSTVRRASVALLIVLTVSESGTDVKKNSGASGTPTHLSLRNCLVHGVVAANTDCTHAVRHKYLLFYMVVDQLFLLERSTVTAKFLLQH